MGPVGARQAPEQPRQGAGPTRVTRRRAGAWLSAILSGLPLSLAAAPATPAPAGSAQVLIQDYKFSPDMLSVKVGTRVKWTNMEKRTTHSILFTGPQGFESERLFPGESWERLFDQPGLYRYTCGPHPEMIGLIEVLP